MANAKMIIGGSIDLSKIDKSKIVDGKNGAKYYNFDIIVNEDFDQYNNNVQITAKQTKEEREAKAKRTFLGNGKVVWAKQEGKSHVKDDKPVQEKPFNANVASDDDLPF